MATTDHDDDDGSNKRVEIDWLNLLPTEVWALIANRLDATIDLLRFRRTCTTCRSLTRLPSSKPLFSPQIRIPHGNFTLLQTRIYRLQPSHHPFSFNNNNKGWIIKIADTKSHPTRLLDPFTNLPLSEKTRRRLNLADFHFVQLLEAYSLHSRSRRTAAEFMPDPQVLKVVLFPIASDSRGARMVFAIYTDGKLRVSKIGDGNDWRVVVEDDGNSNSKLFHDMIVRTGQLYVADEWGTVLWVDCSSLKLVQFSPVLHGFGKKKHLVEFGGSIYVVDMHVKEEPIGVRVYRLDEEWGRWLDVKDLGGYAFVLGKDSNFAMDSRDYYGCEGDCVYFCSGGKACAFTLKTSTFKSPTLFWPCPCLFNPKKKEFLRLFYELH